MLRCSPWGLSPCLLLLAWAFLPSPLGHALPRHGGLGGLPVALRQQPGCIPWMAVPVYWSGMARPHAWQFTLAPG